MAVHLIIVKLQTSAQLKQYLNVAKALLFKRGQMKKVVFTITANLYLDVIKNFVGCIFVVKEMLVRCRSQLSALPVRGKFVNQLQHALTFQNQLAMQTSIYKLIMIMLAA